MNNQTQAHYVYNQQYPGQRFQSQAQVQQYPGQRFPAQTQAQTQQTQAQTQQTQAQTQQARTQTQQYPGAANEIPLYTPTSIDVNNVKDFLMQNGNVKLLFTLVVDGIIIHGVSAVPSPDGYYLALPKRKGSDGKWYSIVYINLSYDMKNYIIDMAWKEIEKLHSAR